MNSNDLELSGSLAISQAVTLNTGSEIDLIGNATLAAGSLEINGNGIQGPGQVQCAGSLVNNTEIVGNGLSITAGTLTNNGEIVAGNLTVTVAQGGFTNMTGGTLTGGTYAAGYSRNSVPDSNTLYLNVGQLLLVDAANIDLESGGAIDFFDPLTQQYVPIQSTLQTIAAGGTLTLGNNDALSWGSLSDYGSIVLSGGSLNSTNLNIATGGQLGGTGTVSSSIVNGGIIIASYSNEIGGGQDLVLDGNISGSGNIEIEAALYTQVRSVITVLLAAP
jgi:fibronectin-binding autotransporter adhesin